jgi:hypothetical protein
MVGIEPDEAQELVIREALKVKESRPDKWAAFTVDLYVGRQNGKGTDLELRQMAGLTVLNDKFAIHTAHELKTTAEHFLRMQQLIEGCPDIERMVQRIRTGKGDEAIEMKNGNRLRFISRTGGSGRGFAGVDALYLDESMYLTGGMLRAIFSTMAAKSKTGNPQMWITGSAPYADKPDQADAHARVSMLRSPKRAPDALYVDWGTPPPTPAEIAEAGSLERAVESLVDDRDRWYATNPALGSRISEEFCEQERASLGVWGFAVERLGLVIPSEEIGNQSGIDLAEWDKRVGEFELSPGAVVAVDLNEDGSRGGLVAAQDVNGMHCVEVLEQGGLGTLVDFLKRQTVGGRLMFDQSSQAAMIVPLLSGTAWTAEPLSATDVQTAEALFATDPPSHRGDLRLRTAILSAVQVPAGERWKWSRKKSDGDITLLVAAAVALASCDLSDPNEVFVH